MATQAKTEGNARDRQERGRLLTAGEVADLFGVPRKQVDRLNLLSDAMPHLPFPHSSQVEGELRELRCHVGSELHRVLYRRSDRLIVLLHIFRKKTKKVPEAEKVVAERRWTDFKRRMEASPRRPPRAAGHDAP